MSKNPLVIDRTYVLSAERGEQVFAEVYMERQPGGEMLVEVAADNPDDRFMLFVMLLFAVRGMKQHETDMRTRVKFLAWEQMIRAVADEAKGDPPAPPTNEDIPF